MNDIKNYINNIVKLINTEVANIAEKYGVLVRKGATVASYDSSTKKATVYFDGDPDTESAPYYNKSGHTLEAGQRVYIFHLFGNPSQGWIMMRAAAYDDDESGSGGGLDGVSVTGLGNALTNASLSDNILTLNKGETFATNADLTTHTGNTDIHVTASDKTRWNNKSDFGGSYNDLTDVPTSFTPASHSHGNITNDGGINTTTQIASGDRLIISDTSAGDLNASSITFGSSTTQYLANNGTWQTPDIPDATTTTPKMDGTAAVGTETAWAKGDHVHPTDTSRASASDLSAHTSDATIHITATERDNWDTAYTDAHTHTNKALLDTYDQTNANIKDAVTKRHTHSNKTVLDGIGATDVSAWNAKYDKPSTGIPKTDLASGVQTSLGLADTAVQDANYVHTDNNYTTTEKNKLAGIASGAEVNQNAFSNIKVGSTTVAADSKTDTLELVAGSNITLTPDATNDKVTITATDTTYTPASANPLMDGTVAVGTSEKYAREDHRHPVDTSRASASDLTSHTGNTTVHITAAERTAWNAKQAALTEGTDYLNKTHLDSTYVAKTDVGANGGVAELDSTGKIPSSQLPSFVDDVLEYSSRSNFPATGEAGKIYIATDTNLTYRWSGSTYVMISSSLALGETSSTAYRGDRGKIAYDHSQDSTVHVTASQKTTWTAKYDKPSGGIPKTDLASAVQTSLGLADTAVQDSSYVHTNNNYTTTEKNKLAGIASGAEVNQNAFSNIKVGSTTVAADSKTDTVELVAGSNITLTPDATNDKITIAATDTTYTPASANPLMDGTVAVGTSVKYAREDHRHPVDTSRASASDLTSHTGNTTVHITAAERTAWNAKSDFSGSYDDLTDKPNLSTLAETGELSDAVPSENYQTVSQAEKDSWNAKSNFSGNYSDLNGKPTIPTTLAQLSGDTTHRVVTDAQINQWNSNYTLPSSGIPLNDLSEPVRDLLTNKTSLFESDIIIGDVYFKRYAAGRLMVSEVE